MDDWWREASSTPDPGAVLAIQKRELEERRRAAGPPSGCSTLRRRAVERRIDRLDADAFALGKDLSCRLGRRRGGALAAGSTSTVPSRRGELDRLGAPAGDPARRALGDAVIDSLYAVERKAMSPRLAREGGGAAPDIRP